MTAVYPSTRFALDITIPRISDDCLIGNTPPADVVGIDIEASKERYNEMLLAIVRTEYPSAELGDSFRVIGDDDTTTRDAFDWITFEAEHLFNDGAFWLAAHPAGCPCGRCCRTGGTPSPDDEDTTINDRSATPSLLTLIRQLIATQHAVDAAVTACDNHYQAGYDTGYQEQYQQEADQLRATYYDQSEHVDLIEHAIYERLGFDDFKFSRARHIANKYS